MTNNQFKITNKYLWFNVFTLVVNAFALSTLFISVKIVNIFETEPSSLIVPLIIINLILPAISYIFVRIDIKINQNKLPKFRIISNKIYLFFSILFELLTIVILITTLF